jgi:hypothetical protein
MPLQPGTTLGPYQVTAKIGEGGMGDEFGKTVSVDGKRKERGPTEPSGSES